MHLAENSNHSRLPLIALSQHPSGIATARTLPRLTLRLTVHHSHRSSFAVPSPLLPRFCHASTLPPIEVST